MKKLLLILVMIVGIFTSCEKETESLTILDQLTSETSWNEKNEGEFLISFKYDNTYDQAHTNNGGECYSVFEGSYFGYITTVVSDDENRYEISIEDKGSQFGRAFYRDENGIMVHEAIYNGGKNKYPINIYPSTIDIDLVERCVYL